LAEEDERTVFDNIIHPVNDTKSIVKYSDPSYNFHDSSEKIKFAKAIKINIFLKIIN
tara:strand:+ start:543 stop:713 length:171 start_codon:yes stop_codon:yes gene_type:complete